MHAYMYKCSRHTKWVRMHRDLVRTLTVICVFVVIKVEVTQWNVSIVLTDHTSTGSIHVKHFQFIVVLNNFIKLVGDVIIFLFLHFRQGREVQFVYMLGVLITAVGLSCSSCSLVFQQSRPMVYGWIINGNQINCSWLPPLSPY